MAKKKTTSRAPQAQSPTLPPAELRALYRHMVFSRVLDERMMRLQRQGRIGFYGTASGEEAAVVGSAAALAPEDWVFPALRQGAAAILRGMPLELFVAQCIGNALDLAKGRQMPVHTSYRPANIVSWSSCIATQLPHAVGMAYAAQLKGDRAVALAYLGDGATSEGDFHVAMNFAGVYRVPVVFFCQNNQWAISVPRKRQTAAPSIALKAEGYGFEGVSVDGNDVLEVFHATRRALKRARAGGGPTLVEAVTYRLGSHSSSDDPTRYREDDELAHWQARDPIARFRDRLTADGLWRENDERKLRESLDAEIGEAIQKAEAAPPLPVESLFDDVYARPPAAFLRQAEKHLAALKAQRPQ